MTTKDIQETNPEVALGSVGAGVAFLYYLFFPFSLVKLDPILCDCILEKNEQHTIMKLPWDSLLTR